LFAFDIEIPIYLTSMKAPRTAEQSDLPFEGELLLSCEKSYKRMHPKIKRPLEKV